mmetsp:Transcript_3477/g.9063  ORF Transcript_3477/g.9063 Transcript_3477/m.9063 type:complete len:266 (-) Transcript_3477:194-991(-)
MPVLRPVNDECTAAGVHPPLRLDAEVPRRLAEEVPSARRLHRAHEPSTFGVDNEVRVYGCHTLGLALLVALFDDLADLQDARLRHLVAPGQADDFQQFLAAVSADDLGLARAACLEGCDGERPWQVHLVQELPAHRRWMEEPYVGLGTSPFAGVVLVPVGLTILRLRGVVDQQGDQYAAEQDHQAEHEPQHHRARHALIRFHPRRLQQHGRAAVGGGIGGAVTAELRRAACAGGGVGGAVAMIPLRGQEIRSRIREDSQDEGNPA